MSAVLKLFKRGIKKRIQVTNEKELTDSTEIVASPATNALDCTQDNPITPEFHTFKKKKNIFHFKLKKSSKVKSTHVPADSYTPSETPRVEEPAIHIEVNQGIHESFDQVDVADPVEEDSDEHRNESTTEHKCEYCMQVCKSKAGLLAHKRNSKACKIKQTEKKYVTIIKVG